MPWNLPSNKHVEKELLNGQGRENFIRINAATTRAKKVIRDTVPLTSPPRSLASLNIHTFQ